MIQIDSTKFGEITVGGEVFASDIYIYWDGEVREARTAVRHLFSTEEFSFLLRKNPDIIIVGTGQYGNLGIGEDVGKFAKEKNIWLIVLETPKAIQKFNDLVKSRKKVAAYIHVTC